MFVKTFIPTVLASALVMAGYAAAQEEEKSALPEAPSVTEHMEKAPSVTESMAPVAPAMECLPICVVGEHAALSAKRMYRCQGGPIEQVLCVDNPADCCCKYYSVPVCVPCCCTGEPVCCGSRVGLLGRGYVTYRWPCGFEATIAFRVQGGVLITYR